MDLRATDRPRAARLGEMLVRRRALAPRDLRDALRRQRRVSARLGEVISAGMLAPPSAVAAALAAQRGLSFVDLERARPEAGLLRGRDLGTIMAWRAVPWRRGEAGVIFASPDAERLSGKGEALARAFGLPRGAAAEAALCTEEAFAALLLREFGPDRAARAARRTPRALSARGVVSVPARLAIGALLALGVTALALAPERALPALFLAALALNAVNVALRLATMLVRAEAPLKAPPENPPEACQADATPFISLIVPLYREPTMAAPLVKALRRLDYPPERLEALIALEENDEETAAAIAAADPPPWLRVVVTPEGRPRTKPRALNHALDFTRGEIVGVYDAEDSPAPDQLRKAAAALSAGPPRLACVQARLRFGNAAEGWIPRCFDIEYATWFRVMLPGFARMGFPLPLGGTSLFIRRRALERLGAWDAHNVTEDADLGIRLARAGYRTALIDSETVEEAPARPLAWIRQRSRWQKGYLVTWLTHMRRPLRLWRDLGPGGFLGFQALFLGAAGAALSQPLFWGAWLAWAAAPPGWLGEVSRGWTGAALFAALAAGQVVVIGSALLAMRRAGRWRRAGWALTLPLYWPLASLAAVKALVEAALAPAWWDKTEHRGVPAASAASAAPVSAPALAAGAPRAGFTTA